MIPAETVNSIVHSSLLLVAVGCFGGLVLFCVNRVEHWNRVPELKLDKFRYVVSFIFLMLALPLLGAAMVAIYIANGDKISPLLAFQIGLTSPAIVYSLVRAGANALAQEALPSAQSDQ